MTGPRRFAKRNAALVRLQELSQLGAGWLDGEGKAITARALGKVAEIYNAHTVIATHASLFPTLQGGLLIEFTGYPLDAEILVSPSGVVRAMMTADGAEQACAIQDIDNAIIAAMTIFTTDIDILMEYDCMPVIARVGYAGLEMVCLGLAGEDPLGDMMGVLIDGAVGLKLKAGDIDFRTAILDTRSHVFAVTVIEDGAHLEEIMDDIPEVALPDDGLMFADFAWTVDGNEEKAPG